MKPGESILYLTKEQAEALGDGWEIRKRDDLSEYVCATPALALKEGFHMSHSFKDKCRQYKKRHPYEVRKMTIDDLPLIIRIARDWEEADPEGGGDLQALEEEICFYSEITLNGVIVTTENGGHAFIMGYENTPEMFTMTMVKHDLDLPLLMTNWPAHWWTSIPTSILKKTLDWKGCGEQSSYSARSNSWKFTRRSENESEALHMPQDVHADPLAEPHLLGCAGNRGRGGRFGHR